METAFGVRTPATALHTARIVRWARLLEKNASSLLALTNVQATWTTELHFWGAELASVLGEM